jgi:hypothetical protein
LNGRSHRRRHFINSTSCHTSPRQTPHPSRVLRRNYTTSAHGRPLPCAFHVRTCGWPGLAKPSNRQRSRPRLRSAKTLLGQYIAVLFSDSLIASQTCVLLRAGPLHRADGAESANCAHEMATSAPCGGNFTKMELFAPATSCGVWLLGTSRRGPCFIVSATEFGGVNL